MKYMVVECHPGYAVVLDENGGFLKVANRKYEIGQMLTEVVPMQVPPKKKMGRWVTGLAAMAACLALVLGMFLPKGQQPYASVYVKINPEVRIDVDQQDMVVGLTGVNQDGIDLIQGYDYHRKNLDLVADELVDKAIDMGYLTAEGQITISLESQDQVWVEHHSQSISDHLQHHLQERFVVTIQVQLHHDPHHEDDEPVSIPQTSPPEYGTEHQEDDDDWNESDDDHDEPDDDRDEPDDDWEESDDDRDEPDDDRDEPDDDRDDHKEKDHHEDDDDDDHEDDHEDDHDDDD